MTTQPPPPLPQLPQVPEGSIIITPTEVYRSVTELTASVQRLIIQNEAGLVARAEDRADLEKLEGRVTALERKVWMIAGAGATIGATIGTWLPTFLTSR